MAEPAEELYKSLQTHQALDGLISAGEPEGLYLECKAPSDPKLSRDQKLKLAQAISGFSNTAGGVIIWGASTTKHAHSGLDIITQLEPIGAIKAFARQVDVAIPTLTVPPAVSCVTKEVKKSPTDSKGIALTYIPKLIGDPLQSLLDGHFYFRSGDDFVEAPYEMIKRLFAATESPDLHVIFEPKIVLLRPDGKWEVPISISNSSSAVAQDTIVFVEVDNADACETIESSFFQDSSSINPGRKVFTVSIDGVIHRGLTRVAGNLVFKMKVARRARRNLRLGVTLYANKMRARRQDFVLSLAKKGFSLKTSTETFTY